MILTKGQLTMDPKAIDILPFGGVGEFGVNCTGYFYKQKLFVVDAGLIFADVTKIGTDALIPDLSQVVGELGGIAAYVITHGHEDHIGALPHFLEKWPAPVFCTAWTAALIHDKLQRAKIDTNAFVIKVVEPGDKIVLDNLSFEWVHMNHSIPHACALLISSPDFRIFHTGDFKIDHTPVGEPPAPLAYFTELGSMGIDLLIADSTNANTPGPSHSERDVISTLERVIKGAPRTTYLTTFSSNLWRIQVVIEICRRLNKKLHLAGTGLLKTLKIADGLGIMPFASDVLCEDAELSFVPAQNLVVLATGCQGEVRAALPRIINGEHPKLVIQPLDTVVFSSRVIPGNELGVLDLINKCTRRGVQVITSRQEPLVHVSGHACQDDIKELIERLRPKNFMPVHGTYSHLVANEMLAALDTQTKPAIIRVDNGVKVHLKNGKIDLSEPFQMARLYVESWSRLTTDPVVLRERLKVAEVGAAFFSGVFIKKSFSWQTTPQLETVGLDFPDRIKISTWLNRVFDRVEESIKRELGHNPLSPEDIKENIRLLIRRELTSIFVKKPVVYVQLHLL